MLNDRRSWRAALALLLCIGGCRAKSESSASDRGAGLSTVELSAAEQAGAYAAALRGAFDVGPGLVLLVDPLLLPRGRDDEVSDSLAPGVVAALRSAGVAQGSCRPMTTDARMAPVCQASDAGYVVRLSPIFGLAGDTVQLYVTAHSYRPSSDTSTYQAPIRLEQRYALAKRGQRWTVARKERLAK